MLWRWREHRNRRVERRWFSWGWQCAKDPVTWCWWNHERSSITGSVRAVYHGPGYYLLMSRRSSLVMMRFQVSGKRKEAE
jgi:hypothetical protein